MRVFCASKDGVMVFNLLVAIPINVSPEEVKESDLRKCLRADLKAATDSTHVWLEDEIGSIYDPFEGPMPVYGPKAQNVSSN